MAWSDAARAAALEIRRSHAQKTRIKGYAKQMRSAGWKLHATDLSMRLSFKRNGGIAGKKPEALMHFTRKDPYGDLRMTSVSIGAKGGKRLISSRTIKLR